MFSQICLGKGEGISITPLPAGHMIGGTIWKIVKDGEEEIVYAVDFNHKKEQHLNGKFWQTCARPVMKCMVNICKGTYYGPR